MLLFSLYAKFSILQKYLLDSLNWIYIWQVSPQLSCGNTCQLLTWYLVSDACFDNTDTFGNIRTEKIGSVTPIDDLNEVSSNISGMRLLSQYPPFRYFPNFSASQKYMFTREFHLLIRQVSPQLSCANTCKIWMWYRKSKRYFGRIEHCANKEINERRFSNPHTWSTMLCDQSGLHG